MLKMKERITITGESVIDDVAVEGYQAQIDSTNPEDMSLTSWQNNKELYKANRTTCRADEAAFEDYAYSRQDELIASMAKTDTVVEDNVEA